MKVVLTLAVMVTMCVACFASAVRAADGVVFEVVRPEGTLSRSDAMATLSFSDLCVWFQEEEGAYVTELYQIGELECLVVIEWVMSSSAAHSLVRVVSKREKGWRLAYESGIFPEAMSVRREADILVFVGTRSGDRLFTLDSGLLRAGGQDDKDTRKPAQQARPDNAG